MSVESSVPKKGEVVFLWFNRYSGVMIRSPSKTLVIDPADVDPKIFKTVDAVLVTHDHYDHLDESVVGDIHKRTGCLVIADPTSTRRLRGVVAPDKLREARVGSELGVDDVAVRAEDFKHPATTPVSFLITTEDDIKIYHTGDSLPFPGMKHIGERTAPDIVFCTAGAPAPGASPKTGVEIVKMVQPKVAIPYHASAADLTRFTEILSRGAPNVRCIILERGKPYKYP